MHYCVLVCVLCMGYMFLFNENANLIMRLMSTLISIKSILKHSFSSKRSEGREMCVNYTVRCTYYVKDAF